MNTRRRLWRGILPLFVIIGLGIFGWTQRFDIYDWARLRNYDPPAKIVKLADDTNMTDTGRRLFYVNYPEVNDRNTFSEHCDFGEESIVLGCYVSGQGIFLFSVDDPRLKGIVQVTAAHEMLHAAYERL